MGRPVPIRAGVGASSPAKGEFFTAKLSLIDTSRGLSSGQTIGAARTAVRPACCLPELRGANRLRRLCPLGTRFPTFPPVPFGSPTETIERPVGLQALLPRRSRRVKPRQGEFLRQSCRLLLQAGWLSSGQTIGAARTAVRPACCCLNSGSLTAFGGCIHWIPASLRSPPAPLRIANRNNRASHRAASSPPAPESARQAPARDNFLGRGFALRSKQGGFPLAPLHPLRAVLGVQSRGYAPAGAPKGFPRGKQSARFALPCVPLVVCLNSGALTAFGGCAHWARASLRSPQSPSVATRSNRAPHRAASPLLAPTPARHPPPIQNGPRQEIPSPPGAVRMFCYPFTAPAITPDTMYFWHAR